MRVLFQGDSVTDCARNYDDPHHLGYGYVRFAAQMLRERHPRVNWDFLNRGISGHRTGDLRTRWQAVCLELKPDILSVLIGINDVWRAFDADDPTAADTYENNLRYLLASARETGVKILVLEPFLLIDEPGKERWLADMAPKLAAARRLARELADAYVPLDGLFAAASIARPPVYWAFDGVHPTDEGAWLIARHTADAVSGLLAGA